MEGPQERRELVGEVLAAYREGAFPMALGRARRAAVAWYEADPRGVIRLEEGAWRIPRRLGRTMRSGRFSVTSDQAFGRVIRACGDPRRPGGWINREIVAIFEALHEAGLAHSVEAWVAREVAERAAGRPLGAGEAGLLDGDKARVLVGGVYGLCVGGVFCAESMFSRPDLGGRDASKVCLARLILHLRRRGFGLIDTQMWSEHVAQFGCEEVSREQYRALLMRLRDARCEWGSLESAGWPADG